MILMMSESSWVAWGWRKVVRFKEYLVGRIKNFGWISDMVREREDGFALEDPLAPIAEWWEGKEEAGRRMGWFVRSYCCCPWWQFGWRWKQVGWIEVDWFKRDTMFRGLKTIIDDGLDIGGD